MISRRTSRAALLLATMLAAALALPAQQHPEPGALPTETLHVYTNRIQLPTLVMDALEQPIRGVAPQAFNLSLDGGAIFHPTGVHLEGDDALDIAILLDLSGGEQDVLRRLPDALSALAPGSFHPQDHLHFYALDCRLVGLTTTTAAADPAAIRAAVLQSLAAPVHGEPPTPACGKSVHLWDAIDHTSQDLGRLSTRRVLIVISPGRDHSRNLRLTQVANALNASSVAFFLIRDIRQYYGDNRAPMPEDIHAVSHTPTFHLDVNDPTLDLAIRSGGFVLNIEPSGLQRRLRDLVELLRSRYVLEFPRPDHNFAGRHTLIVTVDRASFVLPTGNFAPLPGKDQPGTVPTRPSPAVVGSRRILGSP